ncbi:MAG: tetratricopeptide repeat protein [Myxococcales bacterium]|nr:tetratricopeptide repeat protein [Myxococcales bacterium]
MPHRHPTPLMLLRHAFRPLLVGLTLAALGCGGTATQTEARSPAETRGPEQLTVERQVITPGDATSLSELFEEAKREFDAGHFKVAAQKFNEVYRLEPRGELAPHALFNAGHSQDSAGELDAAYESYRRLLSEFPKSELMRDALIRCVRLAGFLERWEDGGKLAELGLSRISKPNPFEVATLRSALALALLQQGDVERASYQVERARGVVEASQLDRAGRLPSEFAQLYFALGEIRRVRGEAIVFSPAPPNFAQVLEERCQLLLDAQSAYSDTMRAYDAHWSAMAGFRVGELYKRLHEDLMKVPPPKAADTEQRRQLFEGAMRLRYSVLLKKGLQLMEHTLSMADRTGEHSSWVDRARQAKAELQAAIKREQAALDALPYTRTELQAALDDLAARAKTTAVP